MNFFLKANIFLAIFISQLLNPLTYVLLIAAAILAFVGTYFDAFIIIAILLISAFLGTIWQYRVNHLINKLNGSFGKLNLFSDSQIILTNSLKQISLFVLAFVSLVCTFLFVIGFFTCKYLPDLFAMLVGLFICAIPEGLPLVLKLAAISAAISYSGVAQDRAVFYKYRRVVIFFFSTNLGQILVVFGALISSLPIPILPSQFLWLNLVTDGFLSAALALEPVDIDSSNQNFKQESLINKKIILKIISIALIMAALVFAVFYFNYQADLSVARTLTLLTIVLFQICNAWLSCRGYKYLFPIIFLIMILQALMIYMPFAQAIFGTVAIIY